MFKLLEQRIDDGRNYYNRMSEHPKWDLYKDDPKFKRLLAKTKKLHDKYLEKVQDMMVYIED